MKNENYIKAVSFFKQVNISRGTTARGEYVKLCLSYYNKLNNNEKDLLLKMHGKDENLLKLFLKTEKTAELKEIVLKNILMHPLAKSNMFAYGLHFKVMEPLFITNSESFKNIIDKYVEETLKFFYHIKTDNLQDRKYLEEKCVEFLSRNCNDPNNFVNLRKIFNKKTTSNHDDFSLSESLYTLIFNKYPLDAKQQELFIRYIEKMPVILSCYQKHLLINTSNLEKSACVNKVTLRI